MVFLPQNYSFKITFLIHGLENGTPATDTVYLAGSVWDYVPSACSDWAFLLVFSLVLSRG